MKKLLYLIVILAFAGSLYSCNSKSKADTWSPEQEQKWKAECKEMLMGKNEIESTAEDFCDCMFEKTAEKYTPEEAVNITEAEEQKIWEECDYSW